jgi:hypothetical protein
MRRRAAGQLAPPAPCCLATHTWLLLLHCQTSAQRPVPESWQCAPTTRCMLCAPFMCTVHGSSACARSISQQRHGCYDPPPPHVVCLYWWLEWQRVLGAGVQHRSGRALGHLQLAAAVREHPLRPLCRSTQDGCACLRSMLLRLWPLVRRTLAAPHRWSRVNRMRLAACPQLSHAHSHTSCSLSCRMLSPVSCSSPPTDASVSVHECRRTRPKLVGPAMTHKLAGTHLSQKPRC